MRDEVRPARDDAGNPAWEVRRVANGYLVRPFREAIVPTLNTSVYVFREMAEVAVFLEGAMAPA